MKPEDDLDSLFAAAKAERAIPSDALVTRILADAEVWQPRGRPVPAMLPSRGWFSALTDWFGGGLSLAGMSAAAMAGLFLGIAQPAPVVALSELLGGATTLDNLDLLPSGSTLWTLE